MTDMERSAPPVFDAIRGMEPISPAVRDVLYHLCEGNCHTFGAVVEWCEARNDCAYTVHCPNCSAQFLVDEDELNELLRWTDQEGNALVCGVRWDD
jgi:hypothetical protein